MARKKIDVSVTSAAAPEVVYGLLRRTASWPEWSGMESAEVERPGKPDADGVGSVRVQRKGRTVGRDEVTELVPNRRYAYAHLSGLPVRDYFGSVDLSPGPDGGTTIRWQSSFRPKVLGTGWVLRAGIRKFLREGATGLARYAERVG